MLLQTELESVLEKLLCMTCAYTLHGGIQIYKPVKQVKKKKQTTHTTTLSEIPPQTKQNITKQNKKEKNEMTLKLQQIVCDERINYTIIPLFLEKKKKEDSKDTFLDSEN